VAEGTPNRLTQHRETMGTRAIEDHELIGASASSAAALPTLDLPTDFAAADPPGPAGARVGMTLAPELALGIRALASSHDVSVHAVLIVAMQMLLYRYREQDHVVIGAAAAAHGEDGSEDASDRITLPFPVCATLHDDPSFIELLGRVRGAMADAPRRADEPDAAFSPDRRPDPSPPLRVIVAMRDRHCSAARPDLLTVDAKNVQHDLTVVLAERAGSLELCAWYRAALFHRDRVERLLGHLTTIFAAITAEPTRRVSVMSFLSDAERAQLAAWNATASDEGAPSTIVELFEAQAARVPARVAVVTTTFCSGGSVGTTSLTYRELNARANRVARHLQQSGVVAGAPVGILLTSFADAIVAALGILKAEGAYMPLSTDAPPARLAQHLAESGAKLVITSAGLARRLPSTATVVPLDSDAATLRRYSDADLPLSARPRDTAYVLFTSGSTGVPKGVAVTHANVVHYARAIRHALGTPDEEPVRGRTRTYGMLGSLDADLGYTSLYPALLSGATLRVIGGEPNGSVEWTARQLEMQELDVLKIAPSQLRALAAGRAGVRLGDLLPREILVLGGEPLDVALARTLLDAGACRVLNHYGPTETTVGVSTHEVSIRSLGDAERLGAATVPIGRPLLNTHAYVVDAHGEELPVGVPGELWLGGAGVSSGYLNRPELSAERYVSFRGERVYRTGDQVRRLADGSIEFLARTDEQVRLRGHRVELGEVEQALRTHPAIDGAAAVLHAEHDEPELVAYAVPKRVAYGVSHDDPHASDRLMQWLAAQLPSHMIPSRVVLLEALPLLQNGKIDRGTLRARSVPRR